MPDKEILLYEVQFNAEQAQEKAKNLRVIIAQLKAEKIATDKEFNKGSITADEYGKSMQAISTQINSATKELRVQTKAISDDEKVRKSANGSVTQMRANLSAMTAQYVSLDKTQRESSGGVLLRQRIKGLSEELKTNEKGLGDNRRNVGNYAEALEGAIGGNTTFVSKLRATAVGLKESKDSALQYVGGLRATADGMGGVQKAGLALGLSLKAIGIGLLITAITSLIGFLKSTDAGMDAVDRVTARVTETFQVFIKGLAPIGKLIYDTFTDFPGTLSKITKGTDEYSVSLSDVAAKANEAGKAAAFYKQVLNDLDDVQDQLIGKQALVNEQVQLALLQGKEQTKSLSEREAVLKAAGRAEAELATQVLENERKKTVAVQIQILRRILGEQGAVAKIKSLRAEELLDFVNSNTALSDAQKLQFNQSVADFVKARQARLEVEQQIRNRESALIERSEAERKANAKKSQDEAKQRAKDAAQETINTTELALIQATRKKQETLSIEQQLIRDRAALELLDAKGRQARLLINAKADAEIFERSVIYAAARAERENNIKQSSIRTQLALVQEGTGKELMLQTALIRAEAEAEREQAKASIKNKEELAAKLRLIDAESNLKFLNVQKQFVIRQLELDQQRAESQQQVSAKLLSRFKSDQAKLLDIEDSRIRTALATSIEGSKAELNARLNAIELARKRELQAARETGATGLQLSELFRAINAEKDEEASDQRRQFLIKQVEVIFGVAKQISGTISKVIDAQGQAQLNALQKQQDAALSSAGLSAELRGDIEADYAQKRIELEKEVARKKKAIASVENIIDTARSIVVAYLEGGPIFGPVLAAIALAAGLAQQAVIDSQTFAKGGPVFGPSHRQGGIQMYHKSGAHLGEMEGGEIVLTKGVYQNPILRAQASAINVAGGGNPFATAAMTMSAFTIPKLQYGGVLSPYQSPQNTGLSVSDVQNIVASMPRPVVAVMDIQSGLKQVNTVQNRADIKPRR